MVNFVPWNANFLPYKRTKDLISFILSLSNKHCTCLWGSVSCSQLLNTSGYQLEFFPRNHSKFWLAQAKGKEGNLREGYWVAHRWRTICTNKAWKDRNKGLSKILELFFPFFHRFVQDSHSQERESHYPRFGQRQCSNTTWGRAHWLQEEAHLLITVTAGNRERVVI